MLFSTKNFPVYKIFLLHEAKNEHFVKRSKTSFYLSVKLGGVRVEKNYFISSCSLGLRDIRTKNRFEKSVGHSGEISKLKFQKTPAFFQNILHTYSLRVGM